MALPRVEPERYQALLAAKAEQLQQDFAKFNAPALECFESPSSHYRMRAEFRTWHEGDDLFYVMFEPGSKHQYQKVTECPMVHHSIEKLMFPLLESIRKVDVLRYRLFQIDFLATQSGELLVTLLYHRPIGEQWQQEAEKLMAEYGIHLMGRARKTRLVLSQDFVTETLQINGQPFHYQQVENSFTQPNARVCEQMVEWAVDTTKGIGGDLVELYCGNGNFTLPLAGNFSKVIATEISKTSVRSAEYNIELNNVENVKVVRISSEEFSQVLRGEVKKRRMSEIDLDSYQFSTVFVDPPRAGLDADTVQQVQCYDHILYISCNPATLLDNMELLNQTHKIERFALFDQFPYTHHEEVGVFLRRR